MFSVFFIYLETSFRRCTIKFYNNIFKATEHNGWITFVDDIPSTNLKMLYIRESYQEIASRMESGIKKAIITGTPGIGKSLFLIYLLWKLVKDEKRVLFIYHPHNIYYNGKGDVYILDRIPVSGDVSFWNDTLWCLFDAKGKYGADLSRFPWELCPFVVSMSPRREMVNDFKKPPDPLDFFMPLWTETELEAIAPLFPNATEWRERFEFLGGIPRLVLESTTRTPTAILEAACSVCSLDECIKAIGLNLTITDHSKIVHTLIHITSCSPFTKSSVCFASQAALNIIAKKKADEAKLKMRELLASCEGNPISAALCGYILEPYAIELLEKGGTFDCHQLVHGNTRNRPNETTILIPPSTKVVVEKIERGQTFNQLYVPRSKNYTAIDAWIPGIGAFQVTVGMNHGIKGVAKTDLDILGSESNKFYWLLPPLYYHTFTKKTPQDIDQYAVLMKYPELNIV
jgi:hypothetical protein